jgi:hypothetical protein
MTLAGRLGYYCILHFRIDYLDMSSELRLVRVRLAQTGARPRVASLTL